MNSAPWWIVLVTALTTGGFALAGSWLTSRSTLKAKRNELQHQQVLEQQKLFYRERFELYTNVLATASKLSRLLKRYLLVSTEQRPDEDQTRLDLRSIRSEIESFRDLTWKVQFVSGKEVKEAVDAIIGRVEKIYYSLPVGPFDSELLDGVNEATYRLTWEIRIEMGAGSRDDYNHHARTFGLRDVQQTTPRPD